jgi:N-acetylmuramoyl-L-alanine amidase
VMNLKKLIFINNACYKAGKTITPQGIMVHSTGANNPNLKRYVGPDDGLLGKNQYNNHWNQDKPGGRKVCGHAFIGKLKDGSIATYQTLPWNHRAWHAGGSANDTHIGFEICEDGLTDATYFNAIYKEATELCAYLCKEYKLDPMADGVIIGHYEGHKRGIASNHADPGHWFPKHGKSMDAFRTEVKRLLSATETPTPIEPKKLYRVQVGAYSVKANADAMLKRIKAAGFKDAFIKTE